MYFNPGPSTGSIAVYDRRTGILLTGDVLSATVRSRHRGIREQHRPTAALSRAA
jgi:glyoxylase-like metal-dependent hydrolase (beta-lactamase superfamily II)